MQVCILLYYEVPKEVTYPALVIVRGYYLWLICFKSFIAGRLTSKDSHTQHIKINPWREKGGGVASNE